MTTQNLPFPAIDGMPGVQADLAEAWRANWEKIAKQVAVGGSDLGVVPGTVLRGTNTTIGSASTDITGLTYTTTQAGTYLVIGVFDFSVTTLASNTVFGSCIYDTVGQTGLAIMDMATVHRNTVVQVWRIAAASGKVIKLAGSKFTTTGVVGADTNSSLIVTKTGS